MLVWVCLGSLPGQLCPDLFTDLVPFIIIQATVYAKCVAAKEHVGKDACSQEFQLYKQCFHKAVRVTYQEQLFLV